MDPTPIEKIAAVLIMGRDHAEAERMKQLLDGRHFRVYTAHTLKASLRFISMEKIDVVLLLIRASGDDPKRLITALRQQKDGAEIPIIVILESFLEETVTSQRKKSGLVFH